MAKKVREQKVKADLDSDKLGEVGQDTFKLLCSRTGLVCNPVRQDRTGWDFLVEFPFEPPTRETPLDRRQQPLQVLVQVKAVWEGNESVSLRLSSAERLAKVESPALIACFEVSRITLEMVQLFAIHVLDEALGKVLAAVRKCEASDARRINKTYVRFDFHKVGVLVGTTPQALRKYMLSIGGCERSSYAEKKRHQIEHLGFFGRPYSGSFTLEASDDNEIRDVFLGLKVGKLTSFSSMEKRFGTELPHFNFEGPGEISIKPHPLSAVLTLRGRSLKDVFRLRAGVIIAPLDRWRGDKNNLKLVMKLELVDLIFQSSEAGFTIDFAYNPEGLGSLRDYMNVINIQRLLVTGCSMELQRGRLPTIKTDLSPQKDEQAIDAATFWHRLFLKVAAIVEAAGLSATEVRFEADELGGQELGILLLHELLEGKTRVQLNQMHFKLNPRLPADLVVAEILTAGRITMGQVSIAFFATAEGSFTRGADRVTVAAKCLMLRRIEVLDCHPESFKRFCAEARSETGIPFMVSWLSGAFINGREAVSESMTAPTIL